MKINDIVYFFDTINNLEELITFFKDEKQQLKKYKRLSAISETVDTFVDIATTSTSLTLSVTGLRFIVIPISPVVT